MLHLAKFPPPPPSHLHCFSFFEMKNDMSFGCCQKMEGSEEGIEDGVIDEVVEADATAIVSLFAA